MSALTVEQIREHEINKVLELYHDDFDGKDLLEIGSGKGTMLKIFKEMCKSAKGVDVEDGSCANEEIADVTYYDGHTLPFADNSFDIIFSTNVLEHIPHLEDMQKEFKRVLKDGGVLVHVLPNATWRFYTLLMHYLVLPQQVFFFILRRLPFIKKSSISIPGSDSPQVVKHTPLSLIMDTLIARRHGETGNQLSEVFYFSDWYWCKLFKEAGWANLTSQKSGIFYSNYQVGMSLNAHKKLSKYFGSGTTIFRMENS